VRRKWPISRVLTVFYTLSASVILFLASAFLYYVMDSASEAEDRQSLADQVEILRLTLRDSPNDPEALKREVQTEGAARRFAKYYARVLTADGRLVIQTGDMDWLVPPSAFPLPVEVSKGPREGRLWKAPKEVRPQNSSEGKYFLLMSAWANVGAPPKDKWLLQLALDVTQDEKVLAKYRQMLVLVLGIGICCSAVAGILIVRKGMRPLGEITRAAQHVTASQLDQRIDPAQWPQDLAELATAFDEMLARLEASFKRLSQFSADLAHEFRTPMTSLRTQAEWALMHGRSSDECRQVLEASMEEYERLSRMIDSLLFLARAENAETVLQRAPFSAANETQAVIDLFEAAAEEKGVSLETRGDACLKGDAGLFRRALSDLMDNSFRHTPVGGRISVSIREVELQVQDTGCGISAEHLPKLFDRFYRVDPSRHQPGAGLGLSLVKSIVELHRGTVSLQSEPGRGTSVVLKFPAEPPTPILT
jgi:two-component system, OmpR family, heavy metal sensor histidine kinase CusS